jgi:hypothetical protein
MNAPFDTCPSVHAVRQPNPVPPPPDLAAIKARQLATWASGDYAIIGATLQIVGESLAEAADLRAGERVLDIAAGNGNATLAAARRYADVTATDYVLHLLDIGAGGCGGSCRPLPGRRNPLHAAHLQVPLPLGSPLDRGLPQLLLACAQGVCSARQRRTGAAPCGAGVSHRLSQCRPTGVVDRVGRIPGGGPRAALSAVSIPEAKTAPKNHISEETKDECNSRSPRASHRSTSLGLPRRAGRRGDPGGLPRRCGTRGAAGGLSRLTGDSRVLRGFPRQPASRGARRLPLGVPRMLGRPGIHRLERQGKRALRHRYLHRSQRQDRPANLRHVSGAERGLRIRVAADVGASHRSGRIPSFIAVRFRRLSNG